MAQLLFLASEDPDKDTNIYINGPRGVVTAGLASYDPGRSAAKDGRLELVWAGGGTLEPRPEPEREGPTSSP
jgi:hypothetical protein